ncbi:MAG: aquaporin, partial [Candidatus Micrarchaeota archaeon]|nr:aquaporin [Candidatus Micrarchaeota archaeon]
MAAIPLRQRAIAETLGTFLLVFIGAGSIVTTTYFYGPSSSQLLLVALAHGIALALAVSIAMGISGGHINPAITVAMLATKRIKPMEGAVYILSQIIGAVIGAGLLLALPIQA